MRLKFGKNLTTASLNSWFTGSKKEQCTSTCSLVKILKPMVTVNIKVYQPPITSTSFKKLWCGKSQRWSPRGRPWPRGHILKSLALASKPQVLGLGLVASSPWPWPRSLKSSKIALSSARGQHYFLNSWNFVGKRQKPRGKFANTFFVFLNWSIGVGKRREAAPPNYNLFKMTKMWQKAYCSFSFSFFLAFFADDNITSLQYWRPRALGPTQFNFCHPI